MTPHRHRPASIGFPNDLEIVITRAFSAPIGLVFDVSTKPEHVRNTIAPYGEEVTECSIDLRVGGNYHFVFVPDGGPECSFRGTFLEVEPPTRTVQTWLFDGWPDAEAVESMDLHEADGVTTLTYSLAFRDKAGRDHMTRYDGLLANFDNLKDYLEVAARPGRHGLRVVAVRRGPGRPRRHHGRCDIASGGQWRGGQRNRRPGQPAAEPRRTAVRRVPAPVPGPDSQPARQRDRPHRPGLRRARPARRLRHRPRPDPGRPCAGPGGVPAVRRRAGGPDAAAAADDRREPDRIRRAQGSVAGLFLAGPAPLAAVAGLAAVNGAAAALFLPAARGVVPQLIPADQLQPGNALLRLSRNGASIAGAALAGVLLAVAAPGWALACDSASFLISAALLTRVGTHVTTATTTATTAGRQDGSPSIVRDLREGWREFRARAWVWLPVAQFPAMVNGCFAVIWVLGPVVARQDLGGAPAWAAVLTANAIGLVGGSLLALRLRPAHPLRVACAATFGFLPPFFLLAAAAPVWLIAAAMLVNGVCVDIFEVLWDTCLQRHVPPGLLLRITSYDLLGSFALGPLGLALRRPGGGRGGRLAATLTGAGLLLAAASVVPLLSRAVRDLPAGPAPVLSAAQADR